MTASENRIERLRQEPVKRWLRQLERGAALPGSIAVVDVTHARDGWLFGVLVLIAAWPALHPLGLF